MLAFLFVLVAVTSFLVAAGPRLFDRVASDAGLHDGLARATAIQRNLQFAVADRIRAGTDDPLVERRGAARDAPGAGCPRRSSALVGDRLRRRQPALPARRPAATTPTFVTFRYRTASNNRVDGNVAGRPPSGRAPDADPEAPARSRSPCPRRPRRDARRARRHARGGHRPRRSDAAQRVPAPDRPRRVDVVGLYTVPDPAEPYWFDDPRAGPRPRSGARSKPDRVRHRAVRARRRTRMSSALGPADGATAGGSSSTPTGSTPASSTGLVPDLRRLETAFDARPAASRDATPTLRSGLLGRHRPLPSRARDGRGGPRGRGARAAGRRGRRARAHRASSSSGAGAAVLALARGRGASGGQLLGAQLWEGLLDHGPGRAGRPRRWPIVVVAGPRECAVADRRAPRSRSAATALLVADDMAAGPPGAARPRARRPTGPGSRRAGSCSRRSSSGSPSPAAWLLRERGLTTEPVGRRAIRLRPVPGRARRSSSAWRSG